MEQARARLCGTCFDDVSGMYHGPGVDGGSVVVSRHGKGRSDAGGMGARTLQAKGGLEIWAASRLLEYGRACVTGGVCDL